MENATKALMIAGAVLIAIMIIGVGMMIFNGASTTINEQIGQVDKIAIDAFNSELLPYEGAQKGTNVKALITKIITLNTTNKTAHPERVISFAGKTSNADLSALRAKVVAGTTYTITLTTDDTTGLIKTITVNPQIK